MRNGLFLAGLVIVVSACGGKIAAGSTGSSDSNNPNGVDPCVVDVCGLLTSEQVAEAMGPTFSPDTPPSEPQGATNEPAITQCCGYGSLPSYDQVILVDFVCPQASFDEVKDQFSIDMAAGGTSVSGVGDQAVWNPAAPATPSALASPSVLTVRYGRNVFTVIPFGAPSTDATLASAKIIAQDLIAKL